MYNMGPPSPPSVKSSCDGIRKVSNWVPFILFYLLLFLCTVIQQTEVKEEVGGKEDPLNKLKSSVRKKMIKLIKEQKFAYMTYALPSSPNNHNYHPQLQPPSHLLSQLVFISSMLTLYKSNNSDGCAFKMHTSAQAAKVSKGAKQNLQLSYFRMTENRKEVHYGHVADGEDKVLEVPDLPNQRTHPLPLTSSPLRSANLLPPPPKHPAVKSSDCKSIVVGLACPIYAAQKKVQ